jgi:hypothetical protein
LSDNGPLVADIVPSVGAAGASGVASVTIGVGTGAAGVSVAGTAAASFGASTAGAGAGVSFGTSPARAAVVLVGATEEIAAGAGAAEERLARSMRKNDKGITYAQQQLVAQQQVLGQRRAQEQRACFQLALRR